MAPSHLETVAEKVCEKHGAFSSTLYGKSVWTKCPACADEDQARWKRVEEEQRRTAAAESAKRQIAYWTRLSGVSGRFKGTTFKTFETPTPAHGMALEACQTFAQTMERDSGGGLWLIGPPGIGKTHLASAIAMHLIRERHIGACVYGVHEVMRMLRARFGVKDVDPYSDEMQTTEQVIKLLSTVPLLVLDEIGVSRGSDWEAEQLFTIVDERYRMERPTILASNLPASELKPLLGDRVYDRLREGSRVVTMNWPSYRGSARER